MAGSIFVDLAARIEDAPHVDHTPFAREDEYVERDGVTLVRCGACGVEYGQGQDPSCKSGHGFLHSRSGNAFDPVVVFQAPDGSYRVPGDPNGRMAHQYANLGYTRIEARSMPEVRTLTTKMNARDASRVSRRIERECQQREERQAANRADLRGRIRTPQGKALMEAAIARSNAKSHRSYDPGSYFEMAEMDSSNRERDPRGRR